METIWARTHRVIQAKWQRLDANIREQAGHDLAGSEWLAFAIGLAGQKLMDDAAQIYTASAKAISLIATAVLVLAAVGLPLAALLNVLQGIT